MVIKTFDKHYYDEDKLKVGNAIDCKVVVNHTVELTEEEIKKARVAVIRRIESETYYAMKRKQEKTKVKQPEQNQQLSLF